MANSEPTLQQVFGANATQTDTTITIQKADLTGTGYVPSSTNTAESSFMAMVVNASTVLTADNRKANTLQNLAIERGFDQKAYRGQDQYDQATFTLTAQKSATSTPLNVNDY